MLNFVSHILCYYSLYNWIGEHEIAKLKKYILASNPEKRTQKQAQKDMRMRKRHLFCTGSHHNVPYEKQQGFNNGSEPRNECHC